MNAYVLIHFGDNSKYLEYELYFLENLRMYTKRDIIYMYSIHDTPTSFINSVKKLKINVIVYGYNENNILSLNKNQTNNPLYEDRFKVIRTCNFIFAYELIKYNKICILESDMIVMKNIDDVFDLKSTSVRHTFDKYIKNKFADETNTKKIIRNSTEIFFKKSNDNYKIIVDKDKLPNYCSKGSILNGGVLLIKPSKNKHKLLKKILLLMIDNGDNCLYPNEFLLLCSGISLYNLPMKYNFSHFDVKYIDDPKNISILHYDSLKYKPLDYCKDDYIKLVKNKIENGILRRYDEKIYHKFKNKINKILLHYKL
jgi:alpha-N-acetylglucosamine transferase